MTESGSNTPWTLYSQLPSHFFFWNFCNPNSSSHDEYNSSGILRNYTFEFTGQKTSKLEYLYRFCWKNLAKVTGPNQFSQAVGHRTTAKVNDWTSKTWVWTSKFFSFHLELLYKNNRKNLIRTSKLKFSFWGLQFTCQVNIGWYKMYMNCTLCVHMNNIFL